MTIISASSTAEATRNTTFRTRLLYEAHVQLDRPVEVGPTPHGIRRIVPINGGTFEGPSMRGEILPSGADWLLVRPDGIVELDIRSAGRTDDGAVLYAKERGYLRAPREVLERMGRGEPVAPDAYALRFVASYETASPRYAWLNGTLGVGSGTMREGWLDLIVHELL